MSKVFVTPLAAQDFADIFDFIAKDNAAQAEKLIRSINEKCQMLAQFPEVGRARNEIIVGLRSFPVKNYIVFYQPTSTGIDVLRVFHGSRDIERIFEDFFDNLEREN